MIRQKACSNLLQVIATSLVWYFTETLPTGLAKLPGFVPCNETAIVAEGKAFVKMQIMRVMQKISGNPEVSRTHFSGPIWLVALFRICVSSRARCA